MEESDLDKKEPEQSRVPKWLVAVGFGAIVAIATGYTVYKIKSSRALELKSRKYGVPVTARELSPGDEDEQIKGFAATASKYWNFAVLTYRNIRETSFKFFKTETENSTNMQPLASYEESKLANEKFNSKHFDEDLNEREL